MFRNGFIFLQKTILKYRHQLIRLVIHKTILGFELTKKRFHDL
jgi:hypothetical protein